jgi:hypothetical protein
VTTNLKSQFIVLTKAITVFFSNNINNAAAADAPLSLNLLFQNKLLNSIQINFLSN